MSSKSHSSKLSTGERPNRSPSVSISTQILKNNHSDGVEDKKELIKTRDLVYQISPSSFSDPDPSRFNHTDSEKVEGGRGERRRRKRRSASSLRIETGEVGGSNFHGNHCLMEIKNPNNAEKMGDGKSKMLLKMRLKDVSSCLTTSKEIVRVLNHVWAHQDDDQTTLSLITALKSELDRAKNRVDCLILGNESALENVDHEKVSLKYRERARVRSAIISMADEVEVEKKLRRRAQRLNNAIAKELAHTKLSLSKAIKDLQRERRAKEIFEQICDELAKGIGEDRAEFEELKKESQRVREEVEKEREMLQLADILREERVQMKLSEAKYEFEQKNAAVETLKHDLQTAYFITQQQQHQPQHYSSNKFDQIKELQAYLKKINFGSSQTTTKHEQSNDCCSEEEEEEEEESDLHSIELNMDNTSKSYKWSFVHSSKRNSFEKDQIFEARKSSSDKIQWETICFNRKPAKNNGDHEPHPNQIAPKNNSKSGKCLRDILFPGSEEEDRNQEQLAKTEDGIAVNFHVDQDCSVVMKP